jgi:hypothetical protein
VFHSVSGKFSRRGQIGEGIAFRKELREKREMREIDERAFGFTFA